MIKRYCWPINGMAAKRQTRRHQLRPQKLCPMANSQGEAAPKSIHAPIIIAVR